LDKLQDKIKNNNSRIFYEGVSKITTGFPPRTSLCKNKHGVNNVCEESILHYLKVLPNPLDKGIIPQENVYFRPGHDIRNPSTEEVSAVIRKLKNNRALSEDPIIQISLNQEAGCCEEKHVY
jgi:hypothetical protein